MSLDFFIGMCWLLGDFTLVLVAIYMVAILIYLINELVT